MKYCKPELSFFIFTSYERSECFIFGVKRKMLHNEVASSEKASFLWSTPVGVWSILRRCRKIWSTADAVWSKALIRFHLRCRFRRDKQALCFFALKSRQKKWRIRLRPFGLRRDKERGIRRRSNATTSASIADLRSRSAEQPIKKSRFLRHAESCNIKIKKLNSKFTCDLEFYYFYSDFLTPLGKKAKKMAEREGFEPSNGKPR